MEFTLFFIKFAVTILPGTPLNLKRGLRKISNCFKSLLELLLDITVVPYLFGNPKKFNQMSLDFLFEPLNPPCVILGNPPHIKIVSAAENSIGNASIFLV